MGKVYVCDVPKGGVFIHRGDVYKVVKECDCDVIGDKVKAKRQSKYNRHEVAFFPDVQVTLCE